MGGFSPCGKIFDSLQHVCDFQALRLGGYFPASTRSSTSNQKPPRLNFGSFQPLGRMVLSRTFCSVRRCFGARGALAHARCAISWTAYLGHSPARAVVLGASWGISSLRWVGDFRVLRRGVGLSSPIRSSTIRPEASRTRFRGPSTPEGKKRAFSTLDLRFSCSAPQVVFPVESSPSRSSP